MGTRWRLRSAHGQPGSSRRQSGGKGGTRPISAVMAAIWWGRNVVPAAPKEHYAEPEGQCDLR
jgi:hypothetical protein